VKLATCNVNGFNVRLEVLLKHLEEAELGVVCVQELTAPQETLGAAGVQSSSARDKEGESFSG